MVGVQCVVTLVTIAACRYGGTACFGEGREGYVSGLNFVVLIVNVVLLIMNLCNIFVGQAVSESAASRVPRECNLPCRSTQSTSCARSFM